MLILRALLLLLLVAPVNAEEAKTAEAVLAGGCFWCMEPPYEKKEGVISVTSGFSGGDKVNPSYKEVAGKKTKHIEAVKIVYDPKKISYEKIIDIYWKQIDPTDIGGQFVDRGMPYQPAIFYQTDAEKKIAEASKKKLADSKRFKKPIVVPIIKYKNFYAAEEYHQDYYKKNPLRYKYYRYGSGRDKFLEKHWGKSKK